MALTDRLSESDQTRIDYWDELVTCMRRRKSLIMFNELISSKPHQLTAKTNTLGSGKFILVALANVRPLRIGVGVEISVPEYYAALEKDEIRIQREFNDVLSDKRNLDWERVTKVRDMWLYWEADFRERQQWPEQHEWLGNRLEAFQSVLKPRIDGLLRASS